MDPRAIVDAALDTIAGGVPDHVRADYRDCYDGDRFVESMRYVRRYPEELPVLAELLPAITTPVTIINGRDGQRRAGRERRVPRPATAQQPRRDHRRRSLHLGGGSPAVRVDRHQGDRPCYTVRGSGCRYGVRLRIARATYSSFSPTGAT